MRFLYYIVRFIKLPILEKQLFFQTFFISVYIKLLTSILPLKSYKELLLPFESDLLNSDTKSKIFVIKYQIRAPKKF